MKLFNLFLIVFLLGLYYCKDTCADYTNPVTKHKCYLSKQKRIVPNVLGTTNTRIFDFSNGLIADTRILASSTNVRRRNSSNRRYNSNNRRRSSNNRRYNNNRRRNNNRRYNNNDRRRNNNRRYNNNNRRRNNNNNRRYNNNRRNNNNNRRRNNNNNRRRRRDDRRRPSRDDNRRRRDERKKPPKPKPEQPKPEQPKPEQPKPKPAEQPKPEQPKPKPAEQPKPEQPKPKPAEQPKQQPLKEQLTHNEAKAQLDKAGIPIKSSGNCSNRNNRRCTSLDGVKGKSIEGALNLKQKCQCDIVVTGGTEVGHSAGPNGHTSGHKLDLSLNPKLNNYIQNNYKFIGVRGDGARQYQSPNGSIYAREKDHWDITFK